MRKPTIESWVAAHRFGLGEPELAALAGDPRGWLLAQVGAADPHRGQGLPSSHEGVVRLARQQRESQLAQAERAARAASAAMSEAAAMSVPAADPLRRIVVEDIRARMVTAATTTRPFAERLALFWTNHFAVSVGKGSVRTLAGAFQREAIRPHIAGPFETLLRAAVTHAAMLRFLDNEASAGPRSRVVQAERRRADAGAGRRPRVQGLNENLAREVLELHTLGAPGVAAASGAGAAAYTQADVTALAALLTGWRVPVQALLREAEDPAAAWPSPGRFDAAWHEPGPKQVLGRQYGEGEQALHQVLGELARHPSTAHHIAWKLARHFVADPPPPALVQRLAARFRDSEGDLAGVSRALIDAPEAWHPVPTRLKSPQEFVLGSVRVLGLGASAFQRAPDAGLAGLGQPVNAPPSPAGWPDSAEGWLGPDAVWKRVEWSLRVAERLGASVDARALARASLGPVLGEDTARQVDQAADGTQALALMLMAPEFQRR